MLIKNVKKRKKIFWVRRGRRRGGEVGIRNEKYRESKKKKKTEEGRNREYIN